MQSLDRLVERVCIEQNCGNPLPSTDLPEVCERRVGKVSFVHPRTKNVSLQDRNSDSSKGLQNASPSELTSEESQTLSLKANDCDLPFSGISGDAVTIFRTRDMCVCSVIEADAEHRYCQDDRDPVYNRFKDTVFKEAGNHWWEIEKNMDQRGSNGICVLEPIPDSKPKADMPTRAVGLREEATRQKIKELQERGWIVPSQTHRGSRSEQIKGFLGAVNWYSIYIEKSSNITAPLMTSLQGKCERIPGLDGRKARCRVPRERNCIQWTPEMESAFVQLKDALSAECELYIPLPDSQYRIRVDACDHHVGALLEQQYSEGKWKPCAFWGANLKAGMGRDLELMSQCLPR